MTARAIVAERVVTAAGVVGEAVVIDGSRVAGVTTRHRLGDLPVVDHPGATIVPGLMDSHLHPLGYAALVTGTSLKDASDVNELVERLAAVGGAGAVLAQRFDDNTLGRMPTRRDLDAGVPDRPVLAYRYCGHVAVANTAALDLAGIGPETLDPPGGSLDRDSAGIPTGVLRETAIELVGAALDPLLAPPDDDAVLAAMAGLVACGLTRVTGIVAAAKPLWCGVGNELQTLCRLAADLPLDIDVIVMADTPGALSRAAADIAAADGRLRFWGWKDFADGSLGGYTASMWAPFSDRHGDTSRGTLRLLPEHAEQMSRIALDLGGVAAIHAIGDRAIDETLDVFDRLIGSGHDPGRMRVEHASVASNDAIRRLAETGVVASVQPAFLGSEADWVPRRLGLDRRAYRFRSMRQAGVRMIGGSDCPVEPPDPLRGIEAATMRPGWDDGEALDVGTALGLFTTAPAEHLGLGIPLDPGSSADLVVVDGELGGQDAVVSAVYIGGLARRLAPIPWPG